MKSAGVNLRYIKITELPYKFKSVEYSFSPPRTLKTLNNCPDEVGMGFECRNCGKKFRKYNFKGVCKVFRC